MALLIHRVTRPCFSHLVIHITESILYQVSEHLSQKLSRKNLTRMKIKIQKTAPVLNIRDEAILPK